MPSAYPRIKFPGYPGLQFFAYATISCLNPYIAVILTDRGLDNTRIGLVLTANALMSIVAQPFWGMVSDRIHSIKKVFIICLAGSSLIFLLMPLIYSLPALLVIFPAIIFFTSPMVPLMDTWTYQAMKNQLGQSYGQVRYWGSAGYAVVIVLVGRVVSLTSIHATSIAFALTGLVSILISLNLPPLPMETSLNILARKDKPNPGGLFRNYHYLTFILTLGLLYIAVLPMFGFLPRLMMAVGGTQEMYSWVMALSAIVEIPVFICARHLLARFRPATLVIAAMLFFVVRLYGYSLAAEPLAVFLVSALNGISNGLITIGIVSYI
ncbi:MAG TPA: hypothetical protein DD640_03530, partial [Clostridiales bacterium]|nr:hypothetical protein [Clostridiales bacterium]